MKYLAEYWLENNLAVADFRTTLKPDEMLTVTAEALVSDTQSVIGRCMAFLDTALGPSVFKNEGIDPSRNGR